MNFNDIHTIAWYMNYRAEYCLSKNPEYNPDKDNSLVGAALEIACNHLFLGKLSPVIAPAGKPDLRIRGRWTDVKQGAGQLSPDLMTRLLKGSGQVLYIPVVLVNYPLTRQEGFIMEREAFLAALQEAEALRVKTSSKDRGQVPHYSIQTFWNVSKWQPHGKLLGRMLEAFDNNGAIDLIDYMSSED